MLLHSSLFRVYDGPGMIAIPLHCDRCGREMVVGVRAPAAR